MQIGKYKYTRKQVIVSCALQLVLTGFLVYAVMVEPAQLIVQKQTIKLPHWSPALNHLKVVVFSDLHVGSLHNTAGRLRKIVANVNAQEPDLILMLGDFVVGHGRNKTALKPEAFVHELSGLKARYGVFTVLGNHDWWYNGEDVRAELSKSNVHVLENDAFEVKVGEASVWLSGVADQWTRRPDLKLALSKVPANASCLMLMHNPDLFPEVPVSVSLSLAGHTHGGQVALPFVGALIVPSEFGSRYARGLIVEGSKHYFVTSGIGTSVLPIRFGVPPEICVLDLRAN